VVEGIKLSSCLVFPTRMHFDRKPVPPEQARGDLGTHCKSGGTAQQCEFDSPCSPAFPLAPFLQNVITSGDP